MGNTPVVSFQKCGKPSCVHDNDVIVDGGGEKNVKHNVKNEQVPIDLMQDRTITDQCMCTCCHVTDIPQNNCIIFKESRYDLDNDNVHEALDCRFSLPTCTEFICKKGDRVLLK